MAIGAGKTLVTVDGRTLTLKSAGDYVERQYSRPVTVESARPVMVAQYVESRTDGRGSPAMTLIPPVAQYANRYALTTPVVGPNAGASYLVVVVEKSRLARLMLDGAPLVGSVVDVPFLTGPAMVGVTLPVAAGRHVVQHQLATVRFAVYVFGASTGGVAYDAGSCMDDIRYVRR